MDQRPAVHRTIVVVDVAGFGDRRRTNAHQLAIRDGLYQVLGTAFENAGVSWDACDHEDRGDGVFILAPAEMPKAPFVDAVPLALAMALREHNSTHRAEERIRLRMALHAGEVAYDSHGVTAVSVNLAFRLLDAHPLKAALAQSPGLLALIVSGWFFDEVVRHSVSTEPSTFRPVQVTVKETVAAAWLSLPDHPYPPDPTQLEGPTDRLVPRQLPLAIRDFTGRAAHLAALDALLPGDGGTVVISAVDGAAGIGKTTLALHWAHRVQHQFPDGTLHVNLRGYGPGEPATPDEVLNGFLRALGVPAEAIPADVEAQSALFRSVLAGRRVLVVLDNANSADQVRLLLPGTPGCVVVVTSRDSLTGLVITESAHRMTLDLLTQQEALALVTGIIGPQRAAAEPEAVTELIRLCARLPLALRIAATRRSTVADVVAELADEHSRLDVLSQGGDERTALRAVFDWSYQRLDAPHARLFRRLGLHPGPDFSLHAAAAVADLEPAKARAMLDDLARAHMIEWTWGGRYRFHDMLRAYAALCVKIK